jgi:alkylation response protein AidB-like acyl-CoA dehydrogenase
MITQRRAHTMFPPSFTLAEIRRIARDDLAPLVVRIDLEGFYPEAVLRRIGAAGGFRQHVASQQASSSCDMPSAIEAMAAAGEHCMATAFMMWCQDACGWYLENSENRELRNKVLPRIASGDALGGTALSNPMKYYSGIEPLLLKGQEVPGGFTVRGQLPWVSNLGPDHYFGAIFQVDAKPLREVMALVPCSAEGLRVTQSAHFVALEGTRTFSVRFDDVFIPAESILADPAGPFLRKVRPGFILLQIGMALGLVQGSIEIMQKADRVHEDINHFLPDRPDTCQQQLAALRDEVLDLARTPLEHDKAFWRRVVTARLAASQLSITAASAALLHAGARGYLSNAPAQRRLRESHFVAILTPSMKHLRKELAALDSSETIAARPTYA